MVEKGQWIGCYGCAGRLVKVTWVGKAEFTGQRKLIKAGLGTKARNALADTRRPATHWHLKKCPACQESHRIAVTWRRAGGLKTDRSWRGEVRLPKGVK